MQKRRDIPNKEGFEFIAVMQSGDLVQSKVTKNEKGLHTVKDFAQIIGWHYLPSTNLNPRKK